MRQDTMDVANWRANAEYAGELAAEAIQGGLETFAYQAALTAAHYGRLYLGRPVMSFNEFLSYAATSCVNGRSES